METHLSSNPMQRILEITTRIGCRLACVYCPQGRLVTQYKLLTGGRGPNVMSWETFQVCLGKLPAEVDVHFSGYSEPWLNPNCTRMVVSACAARHRVAVFTTAVGMSPEDVGVLAPIPFKRFSVHLPDAHGLMRDAIDDRYLATLAALRSGGIQNLDFFSIGPTHPHALDVVGDVAETRLLTLRAGNLRPLDAFGLKTIGLASRPRPDSPIVCRKDRIFQNVLLPSGHVALCCMDYRLEHVLGNLLESEYHSLHRGEEFLRVLKDSTVGGANTLCGRCEYAVAGEYHWE